MDENLFPLPFNLHLALICIAFVFFLFQFTRKKRAYQIIMAASFPATLLLYLNSSNAWRYCVGILELGFFVAAIISVIADKLKKRNEKKSESAESAQS